MYHSYKITLRCLKCTIKSLFHVCLLYTVHTNISLPKQATRGENTLVNRATSLQTGYLMFSESILKKGVEEC